MVIKNIGRSRTIYVSLAAALSVAVKCCYTDTVVLIGSNNGCLPVRNLVV